MVFFSRQLSLVTKPVTRTPNLEHRNTTFSRSGYIESGVLIVDHPRKFPWLHLGD